MWRGWKRRSGCSTPRGPARSRTTTPSLRASWSTSPPALSSTWACSSPPSCRRRGGEAAGEHVVARRRSSAVRPPPPPPPPPQADAEQQAEWLPNALALRLVGTYAQTELGHGTYVRGLETTATFDAAADAFVLHTPTLTATKWWPGGLGATATHAVVMARLFCGGSDRGPHAFIVQARKKSRDPHPHPKTTTPTKTPTPTLTLTLARSATWRRMSRCPASRSATSAPNSGSAPSTTAGCSWTTCPFVRAGKGWMWIRVAPGFWGRTHHHRTHP